MVRSSAAGDHLLKVETDESGDTRIEMMAAVLRALTTGEVLAGE